MSLPAPLRGMAWALALSFAGAGCLWSDIPDVSADYGTSGGATGAGSSGGAANGTSGGSSSASGSSGGSSGGSAGSASGGSSGGATIPISYVQGNGTYYFTTDTNPFSIALPSAVTAGDMIVVAATWDATKGSISQVTDTQGNVYVPAVTSSTTSSQADGGGNANGDNVIYYAANVRSGSTTVTMSFTGATQGVFYVHEYAGLSTTAPLDATSAESGTAASFDSGAKATSFSNELIFGYASVAYKGTAGPSFNVRRTDGGNVSEDLVVSSIGTYAATFGQTQDGVPTSGGYSALMATFH